MDAEKLIPTSDLNFERIPFPQNTSISSQTHGPHPDGLLRNSGQIYIPDPEVFDSMSPYSHNHPLQDIFVRRRHTSILDHYYWPRLRSSVKDYCKSCTICSHQTWHTNLTDLKQLLILVKPWNSSPWIS